MSDPQNLNELYIHELQDLWSANDQMSQVVKDVAASLSDGKLSEKMTSSVAGIRAHTEVLKRLIEEAGGNTKPEHCKGMEGLAKEARKHVIDADAPGEVKDIAAIAQFQRMSHYGIAGFGTAKAYAMALGMTEAADKLDKATAEIYGCDDYMSELAQRSEDLKAARQEG
ncbi:ferritin-like domain-containing protein [Hyphomonas oceanitis]|uniref:YciE/YciF ferroxidase family protein n=1 Tax=Hyphomonas oceanitis TaxID=81033 RepID=UPI00300377C1